MHGFIVVSGMPHKDRLRLLHRKAQDVRGGPSPARGDSSTSADSTVKEKPAWVSSSLRRGETEARISRTDCGDVASTVKSVPQGLKPCP